MYKTFEYDIDFLQPTTTQCDKWVADLYDEGWEPLSMNMWSPHGGRPSKIVFLCESLLEAEEKTERPKAALIVVDVQNDFCEEGSLAVAGGTAVASAITNWMKSHWYDTIVASKDWHMNPLGHWSDEPDYVNTWPVHCAVGTMGACIHKDLDLNKVDNIFLKGQEEASYSAFEGRARDGSKSNVLLDDYLRARNITHVVVVGIAGDYCVKATAVDAATIGYITQVILPLAPRVDPTKDEHLIRYLEENNVKVCTDVNYYSL